MDDEWIRLPDAVRQGDLDKPPTGWSASPSDFFAKAGLRTRRTPKGGVKIRLDPVRHGDLVHILPLQTKGGATRSDLDRTLLRETYGDGVERAAEQFVRQPGFVPASLRPLDRFKIDLLQSDQPGEIIRRWSLDNPELRAYRLFGTERLFWLSASWGLLEQISAGIPISALATGTQSRDQQWIEGALAAAPGALVAPPLTARYQPLAFVAYTKRGAEVFVIPQAGTLVREPRLPAWPGPVVSLDLTGSAFSGGSATDLGQLPDGWAEGLLREAVLGANQLLAVLFDPRLASDPEGVLSSTRRSLTFTSVRLGLDAVQLLGADWGHEGNVWHAFRALDVLEALWTFGASELRAELLDPKLLDEFGAGIFPPGLHRNWANHQVQRYRTRLESLQPNASEAVKVVSQLRNLSHGAIQRGATPDKRLKLLTSMNPEDSPLRLIPEIAHIWWTSLILAPGTHCRPGHPPWAPNSH
jgi:hypothetical protein